MAQAFHRKRSRLSRLIPIIGVAFLIVFVLGITVTSRRIWDGRYPYLACEFTFKDANGDPIKDVRLEVNDDSGDVSHHWPIDDFYSGRTATSDDIGVMRFYCCGHRFGGTCHAYFFGLIEVGRCSPPEYACNFLHNGRIAATVAFNDLAFAARDSNLPRVTRTIAVPTAEHIFGGPMPSVADLPKTEHEFILVRKAITIAP